MALLFLLVRVGRRAFGTKYIHSVSIWMVLVITVTSFTAIQRCEAAAVTIYAFLHTDIKARALKAILEETLPGAEVTAFGRIRDLESRLKQSVPTAILARSVVLRHLRASIVLQGVRNTSSEEGLVVLLSDQVTEDTYTQHPIGVIDLLGRKGTRAYYTDLLGADKIRLKTATKLDDLLPLLQFNVAKSVIVSESEANLLKSKTKMSLKQVRLDNISVLLPAVGVVEGVLETEILGSIRAMSSEVSERFGVSTWADFE